MAESELGSIDSRSSSNESGLAMTANLRDSIRLGTPLTRVDRLLQVPPNFMFSNISQLCKTQICGLEVLW